MAKIIQLGLISTFKIRIIPCKVLTNRYITAQYMFKQFLVRMAYYR